MRRCIFHHFGNTPLFNKDPAPAPIPSTSAPTLLTQPPLFSKRPTTKRTNIFTPDATPSKLFKPHSPPTSTPYPLSQVHAQPDSQTVIFDDSDDFFRDLPADFFD